MKFPNSIDKTFHATGFFQYYQMFYHVFWEWGVQNENRYFLMFSGAHKEQSGIKWQSVNEYRLWQTSIFKNYCHPVKYMHEILSKSVASEIHNFHSDDEIFARLKTANNKSYTTDLQ